MVRGVKCQMVILEGIAKAMQRPMKICRFQDEADPEMSVWCVDESRKDKPLAKFGAIIASPQSCEDGVNALLDLLG